MYMYMYMYMQPHAWCPNAQAHAGWYQENKDVGREIRMWAEELSLK